MSVPPTLSPAEEEALIADATAALEEYTALANRIENNGGEGWEELEVWWGTDQLLDGGRTYYKRFADEGQWTVGSTSIDGISNSTILPAVADGDPHQVRLEVCLDASDVTQYQADGRIMERDLPIRLPSIVVLDFFPSKQEWSIYSNELLPDESC